MTGGGVVGKVMQKWIALVGSVMLSGCVALPPVVSAAGGWYTHDRIDRLEEGRIERLEERVGKMEVRP